MNALVKFHIIGHNKFTQKTHEKNSDCENCWVWLIVYDILLTRQLRRTSSEPIKSWGNFISGRLDGNPTRNLRSWRTISFKWKSVSIDHGSTAQKIFSTLLILALEAEVTVSLVFYYFLLIYIMKISGNYLFRYIREGYPQFTD